MDGKCIKSKLTAAFSLIELMVVIAIIALLTAIAVPSYQGYLQQAKVSEIFSIASDQMNQWQQYYSKGTTSFDIATSTGAALGNYVDHTEVCYGGCGAPSTGNAVSLCPANGNGGSIGVVCLLLSGTTGGSTGAGAIDPSLGAVVLYFTPAKTGSATGDTTDVSISWTCNFKASTSSNSTTATTLLSPGNCTGV